jgi:RNA polymerase sigma-70 factor (ECF subfamily)
MIEDFERVLAAAQAGDQTAFGQLYVDLAPLVAGYARANGAGNPDDLTGDVFVAVVRGLDSFDGGESEFRSWLLTIAHRRIVDERRRKGRRDEQLVDPTDLVDVAVSRDAASIALARLEARGVLDLLDKLTDDQRAVILLRVVADLSIREVAEVLTKPEGAVKALQHRAFGALHRHLDAPEEGE